MYKIHAFSVFSVLFLGMQAIADDRAIDHAPIGVMGDHTHARGEWMLSYRYSRMEMGGNQDGTSDVTTAEVLNQFNVAPLDMTMEMHMFGAMYGLTDNLTLMGMLPYVEKSMDHINSMGRDFTTHAEGLGDVKFSGIFNVYEASAADAAHNSLHKVMLNFGVSTPTGSVDERDRTPMGPDQKLPYPMQLGSGTFDPMVGVTYVGHADDWSWGAQANVTLRFGENSEGYRLGNEYKATTWLARQINRCASLSLRLDGRSWGDIEGEDTDLNPNMVPTARTDLRGGQRVDALVGVNLMEHKGLFAGHRLAAEIGAPIYQDLDGPQLATEVRGTIGWQYAF